MHPRLTAAIAHAEQARATLFAVLDALPPELREARPSEAAWSAAEILEHLARVEKGIAKLVAVKAAELAARGAVNDPAENWLPIDAARFAPVVDPVAKLEAPERTQPAGELSADAAVRALRETRAMLLDELQRGAGLPLASVQHPHPFIGPLDLHEWVWFIGAHEQRHTTQLRGVVAHFAAADA